MEVDNEQQVQPQFRMRVVELDAYMAAPLQDLDVYCAQRGKEWLTIGKVPVVRVFGVNPVGQKTCVHVHNYFPYLFVELPDALQLSQEEEEEEEEHSSYSDRMAGWQLRFEDSLEFWLTRIVQQRRAQRDGGNHKGQEGGSMADGVDECSADSRNFVYKTCVVEAMPFYGFSPGNRLYLKVFLYQPHLIKLAVAALRSGRVLSRTFDTFETHIPFLLHFLVDNNLYGMDEMNLSFVRFRSPLPESFDLVEPLRASVTADAGPSGTPGKKKRKHRPVTLDESGEGLPPPPPIKGAWLESNVPTRARQSINVGKTSTCDLEIDVLWEEICNKQHIPAPKPDNEQGDWKIVNSLKAIWDADRAREIWRRNKEVPSSAQQASLSAQEGLSKPRRSQEAPPLSPRMAQMHGELRDLLERQNPNTHATPKRSSANSVGSPTPMKWTQLLRGSLTPMNTQVTPVQHKRESKSAPTPVPFHNVYAPNDAIDTEWILDDDDDDDNEEEVYATQVQSAFYGHDEEEDEDEEADTSRESGAPALPQHRLGDSEAATETTALAAQKPAKKQLVRILKEKDDGMGGSCVVVRMKDPTTGNEWEESKPVELLKALMKNKFGAKQVEDFRQRQSMIRDDLEHAQDNSEQLAQKWDVYESGCSVVRVSHFSRKECRPLTVAAPSAQFSSHADYVEESNELARQLGVSTKARPPPYVTPFSAGISRDARKGTHVLQFHHRPPMRKDVVARCTDNTSGHLDPVMESDEDAPIPASPKYDDPFLTIKEAPDPDAENFLLDSMPESASMLFQSPASGKSNRYSRQHRLSEIPTPSPSARSPAKSIPHEQLKIDVTGNHYLTVMSTEIHVSTNGNTPPNPQHDPVHAIVCVSYRTDYEGPFGSFSSPAVVMFCIETESSSSSVAQLGPMLSANCQVLAMKDEQMLLLEFAHYVRQADPDILVGYETQKTSIGYLISRASSITRASNMNLSLHVLDNFEQSLSRVVPMQRQFFKSGDQKKHAAQIYARRQGQIAGLKGRIIINCWTVIREQLRLSVYTAENASAEVLNEKLPHYSVAQRSAWFRSSNPKQMSAVLHYYLRRAELNLRLLGELDYIGRTSELARVFGIKFYDVMSRGSQFRVESMLLRVTKPLKFILVSFSRDQLKDKVMMECAPLNAEPETGFYTDPVLVLDFQSLYPTVVISENMCYSTCLGKLDSYQDRCSQEQQKPHHIIDPFEEEEEEDSDLGSPSAASPTAFEVQSQNYSRSHDVPGHFQFGGTSLPKDYAALTALQEEGNITIAPNGAMFVKSAVRQGALPRLLREILDTRVMVKKSMKKEWVKNSPKLLRKLDATQYALKMISNVTYGYTSAGLSGRMPCCEIADAIVSQGRRILERTINYINDNVDGARVIYGDTDSAFVLLKGKSKDDAFRIGQEIAVAVTGQNVHPVRLEFEKVYLPCALMAKKRYWGIKYTSPSQSRGEWDAKGIEVVRRDSCRVTRKLMKGSFRLLAATCDLSLVKQYLIRQWTKILRGKLPLGDFIFAPEVKPLLNYKAPPTAAVVATRINEDTRMKGVDLLYKQRVPFVVCEGGATISGRSFHPLEFLHQRNEQRIDAKHYINKCNKALQRMFGLVGVNVSRWYDRMDRPAPLAFPKVNAPLARLSLPRDEKSSSAITRDLVSRVKKIGSSKTARGGNQTFLLDYFLSKECIVCNGAVKSDEGGRICTACSQESVQYQYMKVSRRLSRTDQLFERAMRTCRTCAGQVHDYLVHCNNCSCPHFDHRVLAADMATRANSNMRALRELF